MIDAEKEHFLRYARSFRNTVNKRIKIIKTMEEYWLYSYDITEG